MSQQNSLSPKASFFDLSDDEFLSLLNQSARFKERSHQTHHSIHIPELNSRLGLGLDIPSPLASSSEAQTDPLAPTPDLSNKSPIEVIYLGNSMLERLKTTGKSTRLGTLKTAFNAGCGGDKNESVAYRLHQGLYTTLKTAQQNVEQQDRKCNIKLWVLASGTNNLHTKRAFRTQDVESFRTLVMACLRIAPESKVLVCDLFNRKDIKGEIVEASNALMKKVVREVNEVIGNRDLGGDAERVRWVEARGLIGKDMLVDHVHLDERGYEVWDGVLWPLIERVLGVEERTEMEE